MIIRFLHQRKGLVLQCNNGDNEDGSALFQDVASSSSRIKMAVLKVCLVLSLKLVASHEDHSSTELLDPHESILGEAFKFMRGNGLKYVTVKVKEPLSHLQLNAIRMASQHSLYVRVDSGQSYQFDRSRDSFILIARDLTDETVITEYVTFISETKIMRLLLLTLGDVDFGLVEKTMDKLNRNMMFYWFHEEMKEVFIKIKNTDRVVRNKIKTDSWRAVQEYDLQGLLIWSISLNWLPDNAAYDCNTNLGDCKNQIGILPPIADTVSRQVNLTWKTQLDPNGDWGLQPKSGPNDLTGNWSGVLGSVVIGKYPVSFVQWRANLPRWRILDFLFTYAERPVLAVTPQNPDFDLGLFIRPFRNESWYCCLGIAVLVVVLLMVPFIWNSDYDRSESYMITQTSGFYFFVLFNAFYGGALTMFFTAAIDLPFVTTRDVMQAYPDWKLLMKKGFDTYFQILADQGDPDYRKFYDRVLNQPQESVYTSTFEGLRRMKDERAVIHTTDRILSYHFVSHPQEQNIKVFARGYPEFKGPVVAKNSPLKPIMMPTFIKFSERGSIDRLLTLYQGPPLQAGNPETLVLTIGQTVLGFAMMTVCFIATVLFFVGEFIWANCKSNESKPKQLFRKIKDARYSSKRAKLQKRLLDKIDKQNTMYLS